ncbi:hypothetical protein ILUMI_08476 [Ignelater luminosus]|uniref:HTH psq-type domain-containing protein n=1 Tax=Ignelater luminosus TaxID=2038154 RepID=A0A8K0D5L9_IGNLU|nr:hypothetical protein ILUMI_08476 [Ignelater luminosus]
MKRWDKQVRNAAEKREISWNEVKRTAQDTGLSKRRIKEEGIKRPPVNIDNLKKAVMAVASTAEDVKNVSLREAGKIYGIPTATLFRHVLEYSKSQTDDEFRRKGIFPLNKEVFSEEKFFPALVTDRPNSEQPASESSSAPVNSDSKTHSTPGPHTVGNFQDSDLQRSPEGIRLYPKAEARKERKKR